MSATDGSETSIPKGNTNTHPLVRNALRISLSAREYKRVYEFAVNHGQSNALRNFLPPSEYEALVRSKNKHNVAAIRTSLRVFLGTGAALKLVDAIVSKLQKESSP